ncbi:hypothetical protein JZ751_029943 [Albula glossodonta]|uniref:Uncharacterized protein n=1 Tax=Albula glossodonta TaxID=121402 RepID=A0A8T2MNH9_9TELE|nr:hypothetical protein JZ751_029943 [Albula glossodonta]
MFHRKLTSPGIVGPYPPHPPNSHVEKITTWQDPRKTMTTGMNQMSLQGGHGATTPGPGQQCGGPMSQPSMVMPHHHQHQQAQAQPMGSSPPLSQQGLQQQGTQAGLMSLPNPLTTQQQHQQKMRLQRIQLERERIRMRQEELMRQRPRDPSPMPGVPIVEQIKKLQDIWETGMKNRTHLLETVRMASVLYHLLKGAQNKGLEVALCRQMPLDSNSMAVASAPISAAPLSQGNMPNPSTDPFLNSVPTTPEDFLSSMEEMDTGDSMAQSSLGPPQQSRFPDFLDSLPGTNVDLGTLEGADLIPILNDVESVLGKAEPYLTWL